MAEKKTTRREFIEKAAYMAPVVLTFAATPSFAQAGSGSTGRSSSPSSRKSWKGKGAALDNIMKSGS